MTENSLTHPSPIQAADRLAEALRNELLEYGHLLELLRAQQKMIFAEDLLGLSKNIGAVDEQMRNIVRSRQQQDYWRAETLCWLEIDTNLSWAQMVLKLPAKHQLLLQALVDEINTSLENIHVLLLQNQQLNLRARVRPGSDGYRG